MINILLMAIYVTLTVSGLILIRLGADLAQFEIISKGVLGFKISLFSLIGVGCYLGSFLIYLILVSKNTLSFLVPLMTGIVYTSVLMASVFILKEKITLFSVIGCFLILSGVLLVIFQSN